MSDRFDRVCRSRGDHDYHAAGSGLYCRRCGASTTYEHAAAEEAVAGVEVDICYGHEDGKHRYIAGLCGCGARTSQPITK